MNSSPKSRTALRAASAWHVAVMVSLVTAGCSCGYVLPGVQGDQCELNSQCDAPLVCRLGYCRRECSTSRDCAAGLDCVHDNRDLGACQLPRETMCLLDSDCPPSLVCTMGECTNVCNCPPDMACRDCPAGAMCISRPDGSRACLDRSTTSCVHDSNCAATCDEFICASDQRCRLECRSDADCRFGGYCGLVMFEEPTGTAVGHFCLFSGEPGTDAGMRDAGTYDASCR